MNTKQHKESKMDGTLGILEAIKSAGESDLAAVEARITELTKELDALNAVKKILKLRLNGHAKRTFHEPSAAQPKRRGRPAKASDPGDALRERVRGLLAMRGPLKTAAIAEELDIPFEAMGRVMAAEMFKQTDRGWILVA